VAGLDDPAAGAPCRPGPFELELVATGADVHAVAATSDKVADPGIAVAAVETETLRMLGRRLGPIDRNRVQCRG
jgi:hypothetical protein